MFKTPIIKKGWLILFIGFLVFFNFQLALAATTSLTVTITVITPPQTCGNSICTGNETCSSCPADCGACPVSGGGGGGGSSYVPPIATQVIFKGKAYPQSNVTLLKDAQVAATTKAGADANFEINLSGLAGGTYIFGVWAEDNKGNRSITHTFSISITVGATTMVSGIFLPPTIGLDKSEVKRGDNIAIFGQSAPLADIVVSVSSDEEFFGKTISDKAGVYLYNFDTSFVDYGTHNTKSKASIGNLEISSWSLVLGFKVGDKTVSSEEPKRLAKTDLNNDGRVNLVDFSIAAYWYKRPLTEQARINVDAKLKADGVINLVDFSIMAYYWTG